MDWCGKNRVQHVFGLSTNATLAAQIFRKPVDACVRRATANPDVVRDYAQTRYGAISWLHPRRVVVRIDATRKGLDIRYVVTNIAYGPPNGFMTPATAPVASGAASEASPVPRTL